MNEIVAEGVLTMPESIASYFEAAGQTVTGLISGGTNVFTAVWTSGAAGQVMCTMGIASVIIGFGCALFHIKKGKRR